MGNEDALKSGRGSDGSPRLRNGHRRRRVSGRLAQRLRLAADFADGAGCVGLGKRVAVESLQRRQPEERAKHKENDKTPHHKVRGIK